MNLKGVTGDCKHKKSSLSLSLSLSRWEWVEVRIIRNVKNLFINRINPTLSVAYRVLK
jgi:hypothetical protein